MLPRLRVKQHALTVGGGLEDLVAAAAVEQHRVGVRLALDDVAAVAGIPLERVVAGAEEGDVVALLAVDEVVVVTAEQHVGAVAAEERVVARAAVDGDLDQRGQVAGGGEAVVAAVGVEHEVLGGADVDREGRRIDPVEPHPGPVGRGGEDLGAAAAVDLHGVGPAAAFVEVGVVAGVPDHRVVAAPTEGLIVGVAAGERVVAAPAEQQVEAAAALEGVVASCGRRAGRRRRRRVSVSSPVPPKRLARGSAPFVSSRAITSLPAWPNTWMSAVLATVGVPPETGIAPLFTRIVPAASRLIGDRVGAAVAEDGEHAVGERRGGGRARR